MEIRESLEDVSDAKELQKLQAQVRLVSFLLPDSLLGRYRCFVELICGHINTADEEATCKLGSKIKSPWKLADCCTELGIRLSSPLFRRRHVLLLIGEFYGFQRGLNTKLCLKLVHCSLGCAECFEDTGYGKGFRKDICSWRLKKSRFVGAAPGVLQQGRWRDCKKTLVT